MNKSLFVTALALATLIGTAHLMRYEPLTPASHLAMQPVWDRWLHRVCVVFFSQGNRIACSLESLSGKPETKSAELSFDDQIKQFRAAGFSEQEILEYVQKVLKESK